MTLDPACKTIKQHCWRLYYIMRNLVGISIILSGVEPALAQPLPSAAPPPATHAAQLAWSAEAIKTFSAALTLRSTVFDQPCLAAAARDLVAGRSIGWALTADQNLWPAPVGPTPPRPDIITAAVLEESRIHRGLLGSAVHLLVAGNYARRCVVPVSALQAELIQRAGARIMSMTSILQYDPIALPVAPPIAGAPSTVATWRASAPASGQPREMTLFAHECVTRAAADVLGPMAETAPPDVHLDAQRALMLLGWLPNDCIVNIWVLRPAVMERLASELPAALETVLRQFSGLGAAALVR